MEDNGTKEKYDIKYEELLGDNSPLSFQDILWLDNLAYFRDLAVEYQGLDFRFGIP